MFSKIHRVLTFLSILVTASCYFGDQAPERGFDNGVGNVGCLGDAPETLKDYFAGDLNQAELEKFWDCSYNSIDLFMSFVRGSEKDNYTPEEIRSFLESFFIEQGILTDGLLAQAMKLKKALFGGSTEKLSREDLERIKSIILVLKEQTVRLLPHLPIDFKTLLDRKSTELDQTVQVMISTAAEVGRAFQKGATPYLVSDFDELLREIDRVYAKGKQDSGPESLRKHLELFKYFKALVISEPKDVILPYDWESLLAQSAQWYSISVQLGNFFGRTDLNLFLNRDRSRGSYLLGQLQERLVEVISKRPRNILLLEDFEELVDLFGKYDWLPERIKVDSLKATLQPAIVRVFGGHESQLTQADREGLTLKTLNRVVTAASNWLEGQRIIELIYRVTIGDDMITSEGLTRKQILDELDKLEKKGVINPVITDLRSYAYAHRPLFRPNSNIIELKPGMATNRFSFQTFSQLYWVRKMVQKGFEGYIKNNMPDRARIGWAVTEDEYFNLYKDFRLIGIDLRLFDPRVFDGGIQRYFEANTFTFRANGDGFASTEEMTEHIALLFATRSRTQDIYDNYLKPKSKGGKECQAGNTPDLLDPFGRATIWGPCFELHFFGDDLNAVAKSFPALVAYYKRLTLEQRRNFVSALKVVVLNPALTADYQMADGWYEYGEIDAIISFFHYIEVLYARFDTNASGTISQPESELAFPIFEEKLWEVAKNDLDRDQMQSLFEWLLAWGRPPKKDSWKEKGEFWWWDKFQDHVFETPRTRLYSILSELKRIKSLGEEQRPRIPTTTI